MSTPSDRLFDENAEEYDQALARGIALAGESKEYFAASRVHWLRKCLGTETDGFKIADYGCGTGTSTPYLLEHLRAREVVGLEVSTGALKLAGRQHRHPNIRFSHLNDHAPDASFDLVFCNGVFHHIQPSSRDMAVDYIFRCLKPAGYFVMWENNPWNPGTHWVMRRIPFDAEACKVFPGQAARLLIRNSFRVLGITYAFVFPHSLRGFRSLEPRLARWPLGAQYQVIAKRLEHPS